MVDRKRFSPWTSSYGAAVRTDRLAAVLPHLKSLGGG